MCLFVEISGRLADEHQSSSGQCYLQNNNVQVRTICFYRKIAALSALVFIFCCGVIFSWLTVLEQSQSTQRLEVWFQLLLERLPTHMNMTLCTVEQHTMECGYKESLTDSKCIQLFYVISESGCFTNLEQTPLDHWQKLLAPYKRLIDNNKTDKQETNRLIFTNNRPTDIWITKDVPNRTNHVYSLRSQ